jgi:hypothetical protein
VCDGTKPALVFNLPPSQAHPLPHHPHFSNFAINGSHQWYHVTFVLPWSVPENVWNNALLMYVALYESSPVTRYLGFFLHFDREELEVSTQEEWASFTQDRANNPRLVAARMNDTLLLFCISMLVGFNWFFCDVLRCILLIFYSKSNRSESRRWYLEEVSRRWRRPFRIILISN